MTFRHKPSSGEKKLTQALILNILILIYIIIYIRVCYKTYKNIVYLNIY